MAILELCMSSVDLYRKIHPSYYLCMAAFPHRLLYCYNYEACCIASKSSHLEHLYVLISYRVANVLLAQQQQIIDVQNCGMRTVVNCTTSLRSNIHVQQFNWRLFTNFDGSGRSALGSLVIRLSAVRPSAV